MKTFDVQGIGLEVPAETAFAFISDPARLPEWTSAFARVGGGDVAGGRVAGGRAVMRTPRGEVEVGLEVEAAPRHGTIDWRMTFPDGSLATAFSRVVALDPRRCVYVFVLTPPPVPLEMIEGALDAQSRTLHEELAQLKRILEHDERE
ncbi:MAG TPA: SRPBCC family protein [Candidatus Polarisedimenticolia bacterium]|nr:SRPBCC family protein [Candidatus Polarisedimenticolia bacterium]